MSFFFGMNIEPDDDKLLSSPVSSLYIGNGGDIVVAMGHFVDNNVVVMNNVTFTVPSGATLKIRTNKILATGTTASNIVGLK